jgi:anti-sigma regulatory factor (Ser/Thr protein kinase)
VSPPGFRLVVPATGAGVRQVLDRLESFVLEHPETRPLYADFGVALDEAASNVAKYAYAGRAGEIEVDVLLRDGTLCAEVVDDGAPFDPLAREAPRTDQALADRQVGGLGIHIVKELMDEVEYRRIDDRNRLRFSKRLAPR